MACPRCGCTRGATAHAVTAALTVDDFDGALEVGLLDCDPCDGCSPECTELLLLARNARMRALSARERHRARERRLARRRQERAERRGPAVLPAAPTRLPPAAAAALARARARAQKARDE